MKRFKSYFWISVLLLTVTACSVPAADETGKIYYALDQNGIICGYAECTIADTTLDGRRTIVLTDQVEIQVVALGAEVTGKYRFLYYIDPETGRYFYHESEIEQGPNKFGGVMAVIGDSVRIVSSPIVDTVWVTLTPETILQNTRIHTFLIEDFIENGLQQAEHKVFSEVDGRIDDVLYTNEGIGDLELVGKNYRALRVGVLNRTNGVKITMWVDSTNGYLLKSSHPVRSAYLADSSVKDMVKRVDLDSHLFAKVGVIIPDMKNISYMKVRAVCDPSGMWVSPEGLNVPGQSFVGTVENNRIEGVFEITHERYDGAGAPPFPSDFSSVDSLSDFLEPTDLIESDAPEIVEMAQKLTDGATDSWDAARRLARWVADEIGYDIPGGGTALNTLRTRMGECGSHSNLLAAFCRAVGIPARVAFGCMYVPNYGGAFGQHAWNEIYMGEAGWIPVDATAKEIDYADCGHIRLGIFVSKTAAFNPDTMEIIDYRVGGASATNAVVLTEADFEPYLGEYLGEYQGENKLFKVLTQNQSLAIDVPGKMVFELSPPNDRGEWFFKLTDAACISFEKDTDGNIASLIIDSRQRFPRKPADSTQARDADVPEECQLLVGAYALPMQNKDAMVVYDNGLALDIPGSQTIPLAKSLDDDRWMGDAGDNVKVAVTFNFEKPDQVASLTLSQLVSCTKVK